MKSYNSPTTPVLLFIVILSLAIASFAQSSLITNFKSPMIMCDYLIICPNQFLACAYRLASYRNNYTGDDVTYAKFVSLDTIEREFPVPNTSPRGFSIWYAMRYAYQNWSLKPNYLVLLGDDSVVVNGLDTASIPRNAGLMPTFVTYADTFMNSLTKKLDTTIYFTDFLYGTVYDSTPPVIKNGRYWSFPLLAVPMFSVGRIPAQTAAECMNYVNKVIAFESFNNNYGRQNKVVLCADDRMQGLKIDQLGSQHLLSCEAVSNTIGDGFFTRKIYLSSFVNSPTLRHDEAKRAFFDSIGSGARWCVYFGHGCRDSLADGAFLRSSEAGLFTNDSAPVMFFGFTCSNGDFLRRPSPQMCKTFLLKPAGGCISYFSASGEAYASDNEKLARALFGQTILDSIGLGVSVGSAVELARAKCRDDNMKMYQILGDPALCFHKKDPQHSPTITLGANGAVLVAGIVPPATGGKAYFRYEISYPETVWCIDSVQGISSLGPLSFVRDSIIASAEGPLPASLEARIPAGFNAGEIKFALYVANDEFESRFEKTFSLETGSRAPAFVKVSQGPAVRFSRSVVTLSLDRAQSDALPLLSVFDLKGRLIKQVIMAVSINAATFDLKALGIGGGSYLLKITAQNQTFVSKVFFLR
jgi:hypothetical protein